MSVERMIAEARARLTYKTAESAQAAMHEIQATSEHLRRSLGQKCRWQLSRIKR